MKPGWVERVLVGILLVIAALIVVHAPLTVWLGTVWPHYSEFIKAWKEILMGVALVLLIVAAARRDMVQTLLRDRLMQLALVYAVLHFLMAALFQNSLEATQAGLLIDLRYILYFVLVYGTIQLLPQYRKLFIQVFVGGAVVVVGFGLLQMFVLPRDILAHIGYSKDTIVPYLTVDENPAYIRINSTLRGPNPVGAYAAIVMSLLAAVVLRGSASWRMNTRGYALAAAAALATGLTLGVSYSRSSVIGALAALITIAVIAASGKVRKRLGIGIAIVTVLVIALVVSLRDTPFIANVILHNNPTTGASIDSNTGHWESLTGGLTWLSQEPLGMGVGSTGSASLNSAQPFIVENQYLFIAHEVGWLGVILFSWLFVEVMRRLWVRRKSALALGVFGSGVGLAVIGLLLPVWVDDTVSIIWWGLAAVAVGGKYGTRKNN